jgi:hypothetical protein
MTLRGPPANVVIAWPLHVIARSPCDDRVRRPRPAEARRAKGEARRAKAEAIQPCFLCPGLPRFARNDVESSFATAAAIARRRLNVIARNVSDDRVRRSSESEGGSNPVFPARTSYRPCAPSLARTRSDVPIRRKAQAGRSKPKYALSHPKCTYGSTSVQWFGPSSVTTLGL